MPESLLIIDASLPFMSKQVEIIDDDMQIMAEALADLERSDISQAQDAQELLYDLDDHADPAQQNGDDIATIRAYLKSASLDLLLDDYRSCFFGGRTVKLRRLFYAGEALTQRGLPPILRASASRLQTMRESGVRDSEFALMFADLQWLVTHYPKHEPRYARFRHVFDPKHRETPESLASRVTFLRYPENPRATDLIASGSMLRLSAQQQRECHVLRTLEVERWINGAHLQEPEIRAKIAANVMSNKQDRRSIEAKQETAQIRGDLWLPAHVVGWDNPQAVAELYAARTGTCPSSGGIGDSTHSKATEPAIRTLSGAFVKHRISGDRPCHRPTRTLDSTTAGRSARAAGIPAWTPTSSASARLSACP